MKKFFGVILMIAGGFWMLVFLITGFGSWEDFSASNVVATLLFLGVGFVVLMLGKKLFGGKKTADTQKSVKTQATPKGRTPKAPEPAKTTEKPTLKDVREWVDEKTAAVSDAGYQVSVDELTGRLMGLNGEMIPFSFSREYDGKADMIAHWKLADAEYLDLLGIQKNKVQSEFNVLLKFNEDKGELRCKDQLREKSSSFGFMGGGVEFSSFSGKNTSMKKEIVIGRKKDGTIGKVVDISLDTTILQNAIRRVAEKSGWKVKRVAGKL